MGPGMELGNGAADLWLGVGEGRRREELGGEETGREKGEVGVSDGFQVSGNGGEAKGRLEERTGAKCLREKRSGRVLGKDVRTGEVRLFRHGGRDMESREKWAETERDALKEKEKKRHRDKETDTGREIWKDEERHEWDTDKERQREKLRLR